MSARFNFFTIITSLILVFCISTMVFADENGGGGGFSPPQPEEHLEPAKLERVSERVISFMPGEAKEIAVRIKNIGDRFASDIWIRASGDASDPLHFELGRNSERFNNLARNNERDIMLHVRVLNAAAPDIYDINLNLTYRDHENKLVTSDILVQIKVEGEVSAPELIVRDFTAGDGSVAAGEEFTLAAVLQNVGLADARDIQVIVSGFNPSEVSLSGSSNNLYFSSLRAGASQDMSFSLSTHRDIKSGSYELMFKIRYRDSDNKTEERDFPYFINVRGTESSIDRANLGITQLSVPIDVYSVNQVFTVAFDIVNTGVETAKNIRVEATSDDSAIRPRTANRTSLIELEPGASTRFSFSFAPTADSKTQNYVVGFKVTYESGRDSDDAPEIESFEQFVGVNVYNPDEEDEDDDDERIRIPRIIIDSYSVDPIIVSAGQEFDISMVFRNTHLATSIENIKVVLTPIERTNDNNASSNPFMPVDGSNTFYIAHIAPGGTADKQFRMYAIPNADPRAYTISVDFEYQDADYNQHTASEIIGITVKQTTRLDTGNIMVPTEGFVFQPAYINFNLMNMGRSTINNLTAEIKGEGFDTSRSFQFFGNLNRGASAYYDAEITPNMEGPQGGIVFISFEDEAGEVTTIEREFVMNVMGDMMWDDGGFNEWDEFPHDRGMGMGMDGMGFSPLSLLRNPLVWVGVVVLIAAAIIGKKIYDRKRRPKYDE
jgi:hypothetical protein